MNVALETAVAGLIASNLALAGLLAWKYVPRPRAKAANGNGTDQPAGKQ